MRIDEMSIEQLLGINAIICRRIDELRTRQDLDSLLRLRPGQQVHFDSAEGRIFGIVIKINRKTAMVLGADQRRWKISSGLLTVIEKVN